MLFSSREKVFGEEVYCKGGFNAVWREFRRNVDLDAGVED
jgi:hypothetical protein